MTDLFRPETIEESLAQIWEQQRPGSLAAAHFREAVEIERRACVEVDTLADEVRAVLHGIGEPSKRAKHDDPGPCRRHVECLAAAVEAALARCDL